MNSTRSPDQGVHELPTQLTGELLVLQAAYRAVEERQAGPSSAVDDALRAAARRAVRTGPEVPFSRSFFHFPTLATPLATAAVIVLTVSIGFLSMDEPFMKEAAQPQNRMEISVLPPQAVPASPAADSASAAPGAPPAAAPVSADRESLPSHDNSVDKSRATSRTTSRTSSRAASHASEPPAASVSQAKAAQVALGVASTVPTVPEEADARSRTAAAPVIAAAPMPPATTTAPSAAQAGLAHPQAAGEAVLASRDDPRLKALAKKETFIQAPAKAAEMTAEAKNAGTRPKADGAVDAAVATVNMPAVPKPSPTEINKDPSGAVRQDAQSLPQHWLKRILRMKSEGKTQEAEAELAKFRERYPNYLLPEELKPTEATPRQ